MPPAILHLSGENWLSSRRNLEIVDRICAGGSTAARITGENRLASRAFAENHESTAYHPLPRSRITGQNWYQFQAGGLSPDGTTPRRPGIRAKAAVEPQMGPSRPMWLANREHSRQGCRSHDCPAAGWRASLGLPLLLVLPDAEFVPFRAHRACRPVNLPGDRLIVSRPQQRQFLIGPSSVSVAIIRPWDAELFALDANRIRRAADPLGNRVIGICAEQRQFLRCPLWWIAVRMPHVLREIQPERILPSLLYLPWWKPPASE